MVMGDQRGSVSPTLAVAEPEGALEAEREAASASLVVRHAAEDGDAEHAPAARWLQGRCDQ